MKFELLENHLIGQMAVALVRILGVEVNELQLSEQIRVKEFRRKVAVRVELDPRHQAQNAKASRVFEILELDSLNVEIWTADEVQNSFDSFDDVEDRDQDVDATTRVIRVDARRAGVQVHSLETVAIELGVNFGTGHPLFLVSTLGFAEEKSYALEVGEFDAETQVKLLETATIASDEMEEATRETLAGDLTADFEEG